MYYETSIGKLSKVQLNNLLKGKNVRVKRGTAHTINLTEEQKYKFNHNTSKGKALTIKLKGTKLHFKSPTAERRHASCVGGWRGSNPRRPAPMEQGMPALTFRLLRASKYCLNSV